MWRRFKAFYQLTYYNFVFIYNALVLFILLNGTIILVGYFPFIECISNLVLCHANAFLCEGYSLEENENKGHSFCEYCFAFASCNKRAYHQSICPTFLGKPKLDCRRPLVQPEMTSLYKKICTRYPYECRNGGTCIWGDIATSCKCIDRNMAKRCKEKGNQDGGNSDDFDGLSKVSKYLSIIFIPSQVAFTLLPSLQASTFRQINLICIVLAVNFGLINI